MVIDNPSLVNFAKSTFPNLTNLVILQNNFTEITINNFQELQSIRINSPTVSNGNTTSLNIRHTPKLTQLSVVLPSAKDAWIQDTSLTSFPDANSDLNGLLALVLEDNPLMTSLLISKMKNVEDYEIINTPIEKTDQDSLLKELEFSDTNLKSFKNWKLTELLTLIIQRNKLMTDFSNNTLGKLKTLTIANQSFTTSADNNFPALSELKLTGVPLASLVYTSDPNNMLNIELTDTSPVVGSTYDASKYPNLKGIILNDNYNGLLIDNKQLDSVVTNIPSLKELTVRNSPLTDLSKVKNFTGLLKLEITNSSVADLDTSNLNYLTDLSLTSVPIKTLPTSIME